MNRHASIMVFLVILLLIPALVFSASPNDEDDHYAYLPMIRTIGHPKPLQTWAMAYGYDADIKYHAQAVTESVNGGFVYGGSRYDRDNTNDPRDISVTMVNSSGDTIWQKWFDGIHDDQFVDMDRTNDGKLIVAGSGIVGTKKSRDVWFAKLDTNGNIIWQKLFSAGSDGLDASDIEPTADGGFVAVGTGDWGDGGLWIIRMNGDGNLQWQRQYPDMYTSSTAIVEDGQGGYFIAGTWDWAFSGLDIHVQHLDSDGKIVWQKAFGESGDDWFMGLDRATGGGIFVAGLNIGESWSDLHFWLMKINQDGSVQWHKELIGEWDMIDAIRTTPDGSCLVAGTTAHGVAWLLKMNGDGTAAWQRFYQGTEWDEPRSLQLASSGGYIIAGRTASYGGGESNAWLLRVDETGNLADCSIDEAGDPILIDFSLPEKVPAIMATTLSGTISTADLVASNSAVTRTVICEPAKADALQSVASCQ